jgi:peroxiredoxin
VARDVPPLAPPFELPTPRGDTQSLAEYLARGPLLIAFLQDTRSRGARQWLEALHRAHAGFAARRLQALAVVQEGAAGAKRYVEETGLPFYVLVDEGGHVAGAYGVGRAAGLFRRRGIRPTLFLIDTSGRIVARRDRAALPQLTPEAIEQFLGWE